MIKYLCIETPIKERKILIMKKIAIALLLVLTLVLGAMMVSCDDEKKEYDDYEDFQTNSTEKEALPPEPVDDGDGVLNIGADTDDGWGPIQRN